MLHIQIDPHCGIPVYRQIMDQVRYHVAAGHLKQRDQLPSIRELARYLHINPTTIVKAYTELQHAGDVRMVHGKGAFVADAFQDRSRAETARQFRERARPLAVAAVQMGLSVQRAGDILMGEMRWLAGKAKKREKAECRDR